LEDRNNLKTLDEAEAGESSRNSGSRYLECICSSSNYACAWESKQEQAKILECKWCGLKRTYPIPEAGASAQIYQDTEIIYPIRNYVENKDLWRTFAAKILREINRFKTTGNLLDIGCFIGVLLEMAREQGWDAYGVEINRGACDYAVSQLGLNVFGGELLNAEFPEHFFDTVVCNHVLEHILDPIELLIEIRRVLKPDGLLVIGVPNIESWIAKYYGDRWYALGLNQHIWQFCPDTLESLLERCSFRIHSLTTDLLWYEYSFNPKGVLKRGLFRLLKSIGKGDAILASAILDNHAAEL
jgi:SAM-dependent methyltransferase